MFKKLLSLVILLFLVIIAAGILSGCSQGGSEGDYDTTSVSGSGR